MLEDQRNVFTNSIQYLSSSLNACMDKTDGKMTDWDESGVKQHQLGMPLNFMRIKAPMQRLINFNWPLR
jgi:hypothetical protein